jgi:hypothetical protein
MRNIRDLSGDTLLARSDGLLTAEVDGELMAMNIDRGTCYGLNGVGTRIWDLLVEPRTIDDICALLVREYDVDPARCRSEVADLLSELCEEGLTTVRSR